MGSGFRAPLICMLATLTIAAILPRSSALSQAKLPHRAAGARSVVPSTVLRSARPTTSTGGSVNGGAASGRRSRRAFDEGKPSFPGWKREEIDRLTGWAVSDESNRPIICEYEPDAFWLWTKWRGTVLRLVLAPVLISAISSGMLDALVHYLSSSDWPMLAVPPAEDPIVMQLQGVNKLYGYELTLCTFILTFFTAEAYKHWRNIYFTTRAIQGRINDICLLVTIGAERGDCDEVGCGNEAEFDGIVQGATTGYSEAGAKLVDKCTRMVKLSHTFFWSATPTCSNGVGDEGLEDGDHAPDVDMRHDPESIQQKAIGPLLLSPEGLQELVSVGQLTKEERSALLNSGLDPSQYCYILLQWVGLHVMNGLRTGAMTGGNGLEENVLRQITSLRAEYFTIGDNTAGRMPLAYVQLVQVLVDSLCILAPFAIYPELGTLSIPATALLTLFFKGLLELSKSFLDPFGNEGYPGQNIRVDVLVSELNFGASSRWVNAGESFPYNEFYY
mmetsp:Transcript_39676/g.80979  ORF Transcript_39676/g.80979 Transcript_39676/m.80979 type:complete len:502 (-) Transcript_39676:863-2368(-)